MCSVINATLIIYGPLLNNYPPGPWARYQTTDATLMSWTLADRGFIVHDASVLHVDAASGAVVTDILWLGVWP